VCRSRISAGNAVPTSPLVATAVRVPRRRDPCPQRLNRQDLTTGPITAGRHQGQEHRLDRGIGVPVGRCRHRKPDEVGGCDLQHLGQCHELGEVQRAFSVLDPPEVRRAHPGQPGDHPQRLSPGVADLPEPPADRARLVSVHRAPLRSPVGPSPMPGAELR
jgi:hypothetical protein